MSDAIEKFLAKTSEKDRAVLREIIEKIILNKLDGFQIKKLHGSENIYRVRKGKFRIVYKQNKLNNIIILVDRRSESTYRDF